MSIAYILMYVDNDRENWVLRHLFKVNFNDMLLKGLLFISHLVLILTAVGNYSRHYFNIEKIARFFSINIILKFHHGNGYLYLK